MIHVNNENYIEIITSSAADVDVVISYTNGGVEKEKLQKITTATTTEITLATGACLINSINIYNIDGAVSQTVIVSKSNGSASHYLIKATLAAGEALQYV